VKISLRPWRARSGSALIEYSFLITIMIALIVIGVAVAGHWVAGMWVHLLASLSA
jgi:Flp pilus assembly pilin Flp